METTLRYLSLIRHPTAALVCLIALAGVPYTVQPAGAQETTILFVYNPAQNDGSEDPQTGEIRDEDTQLIELLQDDLGYTVELRGMAEVEMADTAFVDAIFISESVGSGDVVSRLIAPGDANFGNFGIPIIAAEVFIYDDAGWMKTGDGYGTDFGHGFADASKVIVPPSDHPILGGLRPGPIEVYGPPPDGAPANQTGYIVPWESADLVLALSGQATFGGSELQRHPERRAAMFAYDMGDEVTTMDGTTYAMRARRVGIFAHTRGGENLNEVGRQLIANAVAWAVGDEAAIQPIDADPPKVLYLYDVNQNSEIVDQFLRDEDLQLLALIQDSLGFEPIAVDQNQVVLDDTLGVDVIYISESSGSGAIRDNFVLQLQDGSRLGNTTIPIVASEVFVYDDMQWIEWTPSDQWPVDLAYGFAESDSLIITALDHPITTGLDEGYLIPYDEPGENEGTNQVGYAVPKSSADILAVVPPDARVGGAIIGPFDHERATIFTYSIGDSILSSDTLDIVTTARRVGLFLHTRGQENLNKAGQQLFLNALRWAVGMDEYMSPIQATPVAAERENELPADFAIESVYPNPFNPTTTIGIAVRQTGDYRLRVFDVLGRIVEQRSLALQQAGRIPVTLEMEGHASGLYLIQVEHRASGRTATARAMLLK